MDMVFGYGKPFGSGEWYVFANKSKGLPWV
jgi:hypothetical protein